MDRLFATLFTLYIVGSVVVALVKKMGTHPGPALPPVARPDAFPWPLEKESVPQRGPTATVEEDESLSRAGHEVAPPMTVDTFPTQVSETAPSEVEPSSDFPMSGAPLPSQGVKRGSSLPAGQSRVKITPAKVREALILSELLAAPRAFRPYMPPSRRRR